MNTKKYKIIAFTLCILIVGLVVGLSARNNIKPFFSKASDRQAQPISIAKNHVISGLIAVGPGDRAKKLTVFRQHLMNVSQNQPFRGGVTGNNLDGDEPPEEVCEALQELADYWDRVADGSEPNPIPGFIEMLENDPQGFFDEYGDTFIYTFVDGMINGEIAIDEGDPEVLAEWLADRLIEILEDIDLSEIAESIEDIYIGLCEVDPDSRPTPGGMGTGTSVDTAAPKTNIKTIDMILKDKGAKAY